MKIGLFNYKNKKENILSIKLLQEYFRKNKISYEINPKINPDLELVISVGGDGSFIKLAKEIIGYKNIEILGFNTGSFGFLCISNKNNFNKILYNIFNKKIKVQNYSSIKVLRNGSLLDTGGQDIVIKNGSVARCIELTLNINKKKIPGIVSDGIIISNNMGATGYSIACGNPFIFPGIDIFLLSLLNPHNITTRNIIILPETKTGIEIKGDNPDVYLTTDGQKNIKLDIGDRIEILPGPKISAYLNNPDEFINKIIKFFHFGKRK